MKRVKTSLRWVEGGLIAGSVHWPPLAAMFLFLAAYQAGLFNKYFVRK